MASPKKKKADIVEDYYFWLRLLSMVAIMRYAPSLLVRDPLRCDQISQAASAIQQPFEQRDPRPIFKFFMDIIDHYERMYKEVILPAYKKRLVGPDIHKAPPTFE
jgi:hypothetical protein